MALGIGLTITNTKAVIEALIGKQSAFARTPKYSVVSKQDKIGATKYRKRLGWVPWLELLIGTYFAATVYYAIDNENYITVPFLLAFRRRLLVHRIDVAAARPLRQRSRSAPRPTPSPFPSESSAVTRTLSTRCDLRRCFHLALTARLQSIAERCSVVSSR